MVSAPQLPECRSWSSILDLSQFSSLWLTLKFIRALKWILNAEPLPELQKSEQPSCCRANTNHQRAGLEVTLIWQWIVCVAIAIIHCPTLLSRLSLVTRRLMETSGALPCYMLPPVSVTSSDPPFLTLMPIHLPIFWEHYSGLLSLGPHTFLVATAVRPPKACPFNFTPLPSFDTDTKIGFSKSSQSHHMQPTPQRTAAPRETRPPFLLLQSAISQTGFSDSPSLRKCSLLLVLSLPLRSTLKRPDLPTVLLLRCSSWSPKAAS
jgi:hypothetical protein